VPLNPGEQGSADANHLGGDLNMLRFVAQSVMARMQTCTLVKVIDCTNSGGVSPVGTVTVQMLVNQLDGQNRPVDNATIYEVPYFRIQGGANAMIMDPEPGDIGIAVFASRDISSVKTKKAKANPGSARKFDLGDALYLGGVLNGTPTQYFQFSSSGITIYSPTQVHIQAPDVKVDATTSVEVNTPSATITADTLTATVSGAASVTAATASIEASASAAVTAPAITLGASGQTLSSFLVASFQTLFNSHTHTKGGGTSTLPPDTLSTSADLTSTVTGG
jgi:hypothetical protein